MIRKTVYVTSDNKTFATRTAARAHEIDLKRHERISEFFTFHLRGKASATAAEITAAIMKDPKEFARRISARRAGVALRGKGRASQ